MFLQRLLDIIFSLMGIFLLSPLILIIFFVGIFDTGSPLFLQKRVGKNQHFFTLIKFRSMALETSSVGTHLVDCSSATRLGRILRKLKLDELPQLINVLYGQMSLVGPRPCLPNQTELINERSSRGVFQVKPGITGLAQICNIDMSTPRKLAKYDQLMIDHMNTKFYLKLILLTALGKGRGDRIKIDQK